MGFLRRSWAQILLLFEQLNESTRWLLASLVIILGLSGFLILQYAAEPAWVPISGFASNQPGEVARRLEERGIRVRTDGGRLMVAESSYLDALVMLQESDLLADDTTAAWEELIRNQSIWQTHTQFREAALYARQTVLAKVISKMKGVRSADVVIALPEKQGLGRAHITPSASVAVQMAGGRDLSRDLVEAIAGMVSGGIAELRPQDVVVINQSTGRRHRVREGESGWSEDDLEMIAKKEAYHQDKIEKLLEFIPGARVAVAVTMDPTTSGNRSRWTYQPDDQIKSESRLNESTTQAQDAGAPGARSNVTASITGGGGTGTQRTMEKTENTFGEKAVTEVVQERLRGNVTRKINVAINVPREWVVTLFMRGKAQETPEPADDDAEFARIRQEQIDSITAQVQPLVEREMPGTVQVNVVPTGPMLAGAMGGGGGSSGWMMAMDSPWARHAATLALVLAPLMLMLSMVRKATQRQELPSAEDLAGIPAPLPTDDDLAGEAEEHETTMDGVEVNEHDLRYRKVAEQISELIKANPREAGRMLGKWVGHDE